MGRKKETLLVKKIKDWLNSIDRAFFFKVHGGPMQMAGISDLIGIIDGRFIAIEVKVEEEGNDATKLQKWFIDRVNKCGGIAFVAYSLEDVKKKIEKELLI